MNYISLQCFLKTEKFEVDCIYGISFDHQNGELIAINADNFCFLWDLNEAKLRAKFALQSPGVNICWNRDEKNKVEFDWILY